MTPILRDLPRIVLVVLAIFLMIVAGLWVLRPFALAIVWATMIVVATWQRMLGLQRKLGGKRAVAVAAMCFILLLFLVLPLLAAVGTLVGSVGEIRHGVESVTTMQLPEAPNWISGLPFVGEKLGNAWHDVVVAGTEGLFARASPYGTEIARWLIGEAESFGNVVIQFLLTVVIAGIMYANGETAAAGARRVGYRLAGARGEEVVRLAGRSIQGVALGIGGTAVLQTVLAGVGLVAAGVPFAGILTALVLVLSFAQIGALPVLLLAVAWLYYKDHAIAATLLLVWAVIIYAIGNVIQPLLIKKRVELPLLVIMAGVIGGLLTFGIIGLFIGPLVLAMNYTIWRDWVNNSEEA
jgi:predicted PurR-regulated permease PerM